MWGRLKSWGGTVSFWTQRYGLKEGAKIALQFKLGDRSEKPFALFLPDFPAPIWLRGGTVDINTFFQVIIGREYDISDRPQGQELEKCYAQIVASGKQPLVIDCGANIGLSAIWLANKFPAARIVAIEPDLSNIDIAKRNLAPYPNVNIIQGAVWDAPCMLSIANPDADQWAFRVDEDKNGSTVAYTIDQLSEMAPILLVKIDIEGAEKELFRSNTQWMDRTTMVAIELHDWLFPRAGTSRNFLKAIAERPYDVVQKGENLFFSSAG